MNNKLSFFLLIIVSTILLEGCSLKSRIYKADKKFEVGEYFAASENYKRFFSKIPAKDKDLKAKVAFNQAECFRILNYSNAEQMYVNAIRFGYPDSIVYLRYAQVLQRNGKYAEASKNYAIYAKIDSANSLAVNGLGLQSKIDLLKSQTTFFKVKKQDAFNVRRAYNFSPAYLNLSGDVLFFTSNRIFNKKVAQKNSSISGLPNNKMYSVRKNAAGKWEKPEIISLESTPANFDDGVCTFTSEGSTMYFTRAKAQSGSDIGTEIYSSNRAGGVWSEPKKLTIFADSTISVAHPAVTPDGNTIYFVSDNNKGLGGKDIWKAKLEAGECKFIENLGNKINTEGDEMFPVVRYDGTLYFSSNGHIGLGGLDIFKAVQNKDETWSIENLGIPINSNADDFGMAFEGKADKGFFTSNRGETRGYDAIWSFELPVLEYVLEGKVVDQSSNPIPEATIRLVSNTGLNIRVQTKKDGTYRLKLDKNIDCVMLASSRGYLNSGSKLSIPDLKESKIFTQNFQLSTIYKPIQIENIFYEFGKWELTAASESGLQELVKVLKDNPNVTIEIAAHTDFVGNNESNKLLSEKRAKSVVDYLIKANIAADRLTSVGYGEEKPILVDAKLSEKLTYLKENDLLDEAFISKLNTAQQEELNQINRRTEFRVVKTSYK